MGFFWGSLVAVAGWVVSHGLTLRAQRRNFQNQLLDRARMEIARSLREYEDWLGLIYTTLMWVDSTAQIEQNGFPMSWDLVMKRARDLLFEHRAGTKWSTNVEEYESLFPETSHVRAGLLERENHVLEMLGKLCSDLMTATFPGAPLQKRLDLAVWAVAQQAFVLDQQALVGDLGVHLQNASLHRITGARVPLRTPTDLSVPMIVMGPDGFLVVVPASEAKKAMGVIAKP